MAKYGEERGRAFISIGATGDFSQVPANSGAAVGAGDEVFYTGAPRRNFTWQTGVAGGVLSALNVVLELTIDGVTWFTADTSTAVGGETRNVTADKVAIGARLRIVTFTVSSGSPVLTGKVLAAQN